MTDSAIRCFGPGDSRDQPGVAITRFATAGAYPARGNHKAHPGNWTRVNAVRRHVDSVQRILLGCTASEKLLKLLVATAADVAPT